MREQLQLLHLLTAHHVGSRPSLSIIDSSVYPGNAVMGLSTSRNDGPGKKDTMWDRVEDRVHVNLGTVPNIHESCYALCNR